MDTECVSYEAGPVEADDEADRPAIDELDVFHAAKAQVSVLLTGDPSATRALAWRIHNLSDRCQGNFLAVDCQAPAATVESLLGGAFGMEDGSDRGPADPRSLQPGTVLLRDVGRLDRTLQRRLADRLVALSRHQGAGRRVMASSAEPLVERVNAGTFDDILFYRLNAIHLVLGSQAREIEV